LHTGYGAAAARCAFGNRDRYDAADAALGRAAVVAGVGAGGLTTRGTVRNKGRKQFFFEKKNQKTFVTVVDKI
jgi:hypothetical protein